LRADATLGDLEVVERVASVCQGKVGAVDMLRVLRYVRLPVGVRADDVQRIDWHGVVGNRALRAASGDRVRAVPAAIGRLVDGRSVFAILAIRAQAQARSDEHGIEGRLGRCEAAIGARFRGRLAGLNGAQQGHGQKQRGTKCRCASAPHNLATFFLRLDRAAQGGGTRRIRIAGRTKDRSPHPG